MGDNAKQFKDWHNIEVGKGYQARGVVRQPGSAPSTAPQPMKVLDFSKPVVQEASSEPRSEKGREGGEGERKSEKKAKKYSSSHKSSKKEKKHKKSSSSSSSSKSHKFNPLLQLLATRLSDKTLTFTN